MDGRGGKERGRKGKRGERRGRVKGRMGESCLWEPSMYMNLHIVMVWRASICHSLVSDDLALFHIVMCVLLCSGVCFSVAGSIPDHPISLELAWDLEIGVSIML